MTLREEESEARSRKMGLPLAPIGLVLSTIDSIRARGGRCSLDILRTAIGKSEGLIRWAVSTASELGLVTLEGGNYTLTPLGDRFAAAPEAEMKQILRDIVLKYEPYHTVLLRLKHAPNRALSKSDVTKAWYELYRSGTDSTRSQYTASFASISSWCGLVESRKKTIVLTDEGANLLEGIPPSAGPPAMEIPTAAPPSMPMGPAKTEQISPLPISATISINVSVDTREENAVQNLIRIIRALRGEKEGSI